MTALLFPPARTAVRMQLDPRRDEKADAALLES